MNLEHEYKQLTSVDISEQKRLWDERGKGYYGEYLLFCELYSSIANSSKIIMNLNIPVNEYKTTELDLVLIHKTGICVFEIKHYKGTIYGKDTEPTWTQYFKTTKNSHFKNPVLQNQYHIEHLSKLFPDVPIYSFIVFTNEDCSLRVENLHDNITITTLRDVKTDLRNWTKTREEKYSLEQIDEMFAKLTPYSNMTTPVIIDGEAADFFAWIKPTLNTLQEKIIETETEKENLLKKQKDLKKTKIIGIISLIAIALCIAMFSFLSAKIAIQLNIELCEKEIQQKDDELKQFKQHFLHVYEIDNEYIDALNSYVEVSNVTLSPLTDDAVSFKANLSILTEQYGYEINKESMYIVMTEDGEVFEYNFDNYIISHNGYFSIVELNDFQFYGISDVNDIAYVKITGVQLFETNPYKKTIKDNLEIELYCKDSE